MKTHRTPSNALPVAWSVHWLSHASRHSERLLESGGQPVRTGTKACASGSAWTRGRGKARRQKRGSAVRRLRGREGVRGAVRSTDGAV